MSKGRVVIVEENSMVPLDRRVWYEATSLRDAGWDVTVICPAATGAHAGNEADKTFIKKPQALEGISVYRFPLVFSEGGSWSYMVEFASAFFWIAFLTMKVWLERKFDIIHFCNPPDIFFPLGLVYRLLGAKFVFDHHDLFPEMIAERFLGRMGRILYGLSRWLERLTYRCANLVIATNESFREIGIQRNKVSASKVIVVRNGPRINDFRSTGSLPELKKGFPYMIGYAGIMGDFDGVEELAEIIRTIVVERGRTDILFALIGDGSGHERLKHRIEAWGLENYVDMPGLIQNDALLKSYLSTADLLISPEPLTPMNDRSTFIKIGEYMAMSKPIVAFDLRETRFTAETACLYVENGRIDEFSNSICQLLADENKRNEMGAFGRRRVEELLCWEKQKEKLIDTYRSIVKS